MPAIAIECLGGDVRGSRRREEDDQVRELAGEAQSPQGNERLPASPKSLIEEAAQCRVAIVGIGL